MGKADTSSMANREAHCDAPSGGAANAATVAGRVDRLTAIQERPHEYALRLLRRTSVSAAAGAMSLAST
jgi:hypothetical protein